MKNTKYRGLPSKYHLIGLVPAYKPGSGLIDLLRSLNRLELFDAIYCVDDGGGEEFKGIFEKVDKLGVNVCVHFVNQGKGAALKTGLNRIACDYPQNSWVVTFDADGQHTPHDIVAVARKAGEAGEGGEGGEENRLILGARSRLEEAPFRSKFGNLLTRTILKAVSGIDLMDTQTGLRCIPLSFAGELLGIKSNGYEFEFDMFVRAKRRGMTFQEVQIETVYINENETSHFNPVFDSIKIYFVFFRFCSVSLGAALLDNLTFMFMYLLSKNILVSLVLARILGATFQYLATRGFVFHSHSSIRHSLVKYLIVLFVLSALSAGGIWFLREQYSVQPILSKILIETFVFFLSFAYLRDWVFRESLESDA